MLAACMTRFARAASTVQTKEGNQNSLQSGDLCEIDVRCSGSAVLSESSIICKISSYREI